MKQRYDKEDDVLMIWFSRERVDHAQHAKQTILHLSADNKPVLLEILNASKFLKNSYRALAPRLRSSAAA